MTTVGRRGPQRRPETTYSREHRRDARSDGPIVLPISCDLPIPDLPEGRAWSPAERSTWNMLWREPPAVMWRDADIPLVAAYVQYVHQGYAGRATAGLAAEARHAADALGLSPAGRRSLNWVLQDVDTAGEDEA